METLDSATASGALTAAMFSRFPNVAATVKTIHGQRGKTDFIKITLPGSNGRLNGGDIPTLGIIGRLGGIGARPQRIGLVSDADGAIAALSAALKLAHMTSQGDQLPGDVIVTTHICPDAPTRPHKPVDFMDSPVDMEVMNEHEVTDEMEAILSIDTTKGNRIVNHKGIAISPTVKSGWILPVSTDLVRILESVSGMLPITFPLSQQDITSTATACTTSTASCSQPPPPWPQWSALPSARRASCPVAVPAPAMRLISPWRRDSLLRWPKTWGKGRANSIIRRNSIV